MPKAWGAPPAKLERPRVSMGDGLRELAAAIRYASRPRFVDIGPQIVDARRVEAIEDGRLIMQGGRFQDATGTAIYLHDLITEVLNAGD